MAELKTQKTTASVTEYIKTIENEHKRNDAKILLKLFRETTGYKGALWGTSIIGFGSYHYKSKRSSQQGDWPLTGFAIRKANISIYIMPGFSNYKTELANLGKHKVSSGSCLYITKLADIQITILKKIIADSVKVMKERYAVK